MFSAFPNGLPGLALLLLRAALGAAAIWRGGSYVWSNVNSLNSNAVIGAALIAVGVLLLIGFLTPLSATIASLAAFAQTLSVFSAAGFAAFESAAFAAYLFVTAIAIALLGPGAFSLDARLFGRREIIIPEKISPPES